MHLSRKTAMILLTLVLVLCMCAFSSVTENKSKVTFFNNILIPADTVLDGDAIAIFGNITVDGTIRGDVAAIFGNITVRGRIDGDVAAVLGNVKVSPTGQIEGDVAGVGGGVHTEPGGMVRGEIADVNANMNLGRHNVIPAIAYASIILLALMYMLSCITAAIIPDRIRMMTETSLDRMLRRFGIGLLVYILFVPFVIGLVITVVGVIAIPVLVLAYAAASLVGATALWIAIGQRLTGNMEGKSSIFIHLLVGLTITYVFMLVPVIGWLFSLAFSNIAMGLAVDTRVGSPVLKK